jgi:chorismate--pyruvate lyase
MRKTYNYLACQSTWWPDNALSIAKLNPKIALLASDKGSLTSALVDISDNNFSVKVLEQVIKLPFFHEQLELQRPLSRAAMIREVELQLYGETAVFARSIIPLSLVSKGRNGLASLGRTPLGHLLFKDGQIRESRRQFSQTSYQGDQVAARRTPYDYQGSQILVSEFFLPAIYKYL